MPKRTTHTIDATGQSLGRLATQIVSILRGKHKPSFETHIDGGDAVVVTNVQLVKITGKKLTQKTFYKHTLYPGGIRTTLLKDMKQNNPARLIQMTVRGMLPDNKLRKEMLKRLTIQ